MNEVKLIPWNEKSSALLPPCTTGVLAGLFSSQIQVEQSPIYRCGDVIVLNDAKYQAPFRHLFKITPHDPEMLKNLHEGLKKIEHVFLRTKCHCITRFRYWFLDVDHGVNIQKIMSSLFIKGLIGTELGLEAEPYESTARGLAMVFKIGLVINGEHADRYRAFLFILPFYLKLTSVAKRTFELLAERPALQEQIKQRLKTLIDDLFARLREEHLNQFQELDQLFNIALKEDRALYFSRDIAADYELVDGEKSYKISKGTKVVFPCHVEAPLCPGFQSGLTVLRVFFLFLMWKGVIEKEVKQAGNILFPTTRTLYKFKVTRSSYD